MDTTKRMYGESDAQYVQRLKTEIIEISRALAEIGQSTMTAVFIEHGDGPDYITRFKWCKDLIPRTGYLAVLVGEVARPPKRPGNCDHHFVPAFDERGNHIGVRCCKCG